MIIFGSSKDALYPFWRVWALDSEDEIVIPLAHFSDKNKSDVAAFELAHSLGSLEDPEGMETILASKTSAATPLPPKLVAFFTTLAKNAIQTSQAAEPGKSVITANTTPDDTVHVVRIPHA